MRLPTGKKLEAGLALSETKVREKILGLMDTGFSGYAALMIEGFDGLEEGTLLFKKGKCIASLYEFVKFDLIVMGDLALRHFFNSAGASNGILDIFTLSMLQVDMSLAFDEKIKLSRELDRKAMEKYQVKKFDQGISKKTLEDAVEIGQKQSKKDVFKRFGLGEFAK